MNKTLALCQARHNMPECVEGAIFGNTLDPLDLGGMAETVEAALDGVDELTLYVTGLSVALVEVIKYCESNGVSLVLMHFDRDTGDYYPQGVCSFTPCPWCGRQMRSTDWQCPHCGGN